VERDLAGWSERYIVRAQQQEPLRLEAIPLARIEVMRLICRKVRINPRTGFAQIVWSPT
jgi:hypothetical protein